MSGTNKLFLRQRCHFYLLAGVLVLPLSPAMANEVTWDMDGAQFTGVNGLQVGLDYYDVDFMNGSCLSLFSFCGGSGRYDLAFSQSEAIEASEELLAAIDNISLADDPSALFGIDTSSGIIFTGYDDDGGGVNGVAVTYVFNGLNTLGTGGSTWAADAVTGAGMVWAVWTPASPH